MQSIYLTIVLAPLAAAIIAGLFGRVIGRTGAHSVAIAGVALSCALSLYVLYKILFEGMGTFDGTVSTDNVQGDSARFTRGWSATA